MKSEVSGLSIAAHELKAPLNLMRQLALSLELENTPERQSDICNQIVSVSERAIKQVNDLSKIARLEDGLFAMEPVSVRGVCDDVVEELRALFKFNKRDLTVKYSNRERLAVANRELLYSVVYNFCLNAIHYSNENTKSSLSIQDKRDHIRISVRDFGPALPTKIWHEMRQGCLNQPTSIAMRPGSSGLGLYIASKFSKYMNANVGAIRHRDGTSFFVDLPISKQASLFV